MTRAGMGQRRFLLAAGGTLGVGALSCAGLTVLATLQPDARIDWIESTYGGKAR